MVTVRWDFRVFLTRRYANRSSASTARQKPTFSTVSLTNHFAAGFEPNQMPTHVRSYPNTYRCRGSSPQRLHRAPPSLGSSRHTSPRSRRSASDYRTDTSHRQCPCPACKRFGCTCHCRKSSMECIPMMPPTFPTMECQSLSRARVDRENHDTFGQRSVASDI